MDVIALISGGKDSFFSLLHTIANGNRVVALANLHPPSPGTPGETITTHLPSSPRIIPPATPETKDELDSFMYQTVGHTVLPLYSHALNIPLYRKAITGTSVDQNLSYMLSGKRGDETEDLVPLLEHIIRKHPGVKAICTGAILSTYQRTRVESVCERLGLVSMSYLWQRRQEEILADMEEVGLDARVVKVAAVGLDTEGWLWTNVTEGRRRRMLDKLERKWGVHVAGEGGEYETVVVDGPGWKGRIEVKEDWRETVSAGGGVGHLRITNASFVPKDGLEDMDQKEWVKDLRIPDIWDSEFTKILQEVATTFPSTLPGRSPPPQKSPLVTSSPPKHSIHVFSETLFINNITSPSPSPNTSIISESSSIMQALSTLLAAHSTSFEHISSITLLLRSMSDFTTINNTYSSYFTTPLPPSRVCVAVGDLLPEGTNLMISVTAHLSLPVLRRGLHVQSRSYWAPANIGPYSQSITAGGWTSLAGMIPLLPASMELINNAETHREVLEQSVLGLQHMWRVARAAEVTGILGCVAFIVDPSAVHAVSRSWEALWRGWKGSVGWKGLWKHSTEGDGEGSDDEEEGFMPPLIIAQIAHLPRSSAVEWAGTGLDGPWLHKLHTSYNEKHSSFSFPCLHTGPRSTTYGPNAPHAPAGGLQMFCLSRSPVGALAIEVKRQVCAEQTEAGNATVYVPRGTASAGEFARAWEECAGGGLAMQVLPVERVWDSKGMEVGVGVTVRLAEKGDF